MSRREVVLQLAAAGALSSLPACTRLLGESARLRDDPFTLGVASGFPQPDSMVLWTRLLPQSDDPAGGSPPAAIPVGWEVAGDDRFARILRRGTTFALPELAHSIHVEPAGLEPGRPYWYRFTAGGARSPVGQTATAPAADGMPSRLRLAVASCQHYEQGLYVAYRHIVADEPDLLVHVGDYIYETAATTDGVRTHGSGECQTLADYRARYALYRSDPDLQAAHAACPWLVTWDDHEVDNDYASDVSEQDDDPVQFLARRAAAYQAYYEHTPLPARARPAGPDSLLYGARQWGGLATLRMLDTRQYRVPHACPKPGRRGANRVSGCAELFSAERTKLGERQEAWLAASLAASTARWNLVAQGTLMTYVDEQPGPGEVFWTDSWNGYPSARERLMGLLGRGVRNPVVLSGDIHAFVVADLNAVPSDPDSPRVASEFVATSISSNGLPQSLIDEWFSSNRNVMLARSDVRGYVRMDIGRDLLRADLIAISSVNDRAAGRSVLASYLVEDGRPGPVPA